MCSQGTDVLNLCKDGIKLFVECLPYRKQLEFTEFNLVKRRQSVWFLNV